MMIIFFIGLFSLCIGSFLNVVITRLPMMLNAEDRATKEVSLLFPRSFCPHCLHFIPWFHNIPLVSFLVLKGRCSYCAGRISWRYPLIELSTLILSVIVYVHFGNSWFMCDALLFTWYLIALTAIDMETRTLPDLLTLSLLWFGLLQNNVMDKISLENAVFGVTAGYMGFALVNGLYRLYRGRDGLGRGDWKLLAAFGAWFGADALLWIVMFAALLGSIYGLMQLFLKRATMQTQLPFGPFLCIAAWFFLMF